MQHHPPDSNRLRCREDVRLAKRHLMGRLRRLYPVHSRSFILSGLCLCIPLTLFLLLIRYLTSDGYDVTFLDDIQWPNIPAYIPHIPKRIIQKSKSSSDIDIERNSFVRLNPTYVYTHYNDSAAEYFVKSTMSESIYHAYMSLPNPVMKADYFRYIVLLVHGGIYSDVDTVCLQPIETWTNGTAGNRIGFIVGIEADASFWDVWQGDYARTIQFVQWTIGAAPGHPVLYQIVKRIADISSRMSRERLNNELVLEWTGPGIWTDVIEKYFADKYHFSLRQLRNLAHPMLVGENTYVLPMTGFSPGIKRMNSKPVTDPEAKVQHLFAGSWKNKI